VGTDAPVLSALVGAGGNGRRRPANAKNRRIRPWPLETETPRRTTAYLKVEKPRFLFLEGSADAAAVPVAAAVAPPDVAAAPLATVATPPDVVAALVAAGATLLDAAAVRAGASATRSDALAARALPRALAPLPLAGPLATGVEAPTSREPAPIAPFFLLLLRRRDLRSHRLKESLLLAQPVLLAVLLPALPPSNASLLLARGLGAWAGRTAGCLRSPSAEKTVVRTALVRCENRRREGRPLTAGVSGSIANDQRSSLLYLPPLRLIARLALVAAYSVGKRSFSSRERANDTGLAASLIS
jgi:hypothetical protein